MSVVKIKYEDALSMYLALNSKKAPTWDAKRMAAQLMRLPEIIDGESEEVKALEGTDAKTFDTVCEAVADGKKITVTESAKASEASVDAAAEEEPTTKKKPTSKKKPTTKKPAAKAAPEKSSKRPTKKAADKSTKASPKKKSANARGERGHTAKDKAFAKFLAKPSIGASALEEFLEGKVTINTARSWLSGWAKGSGLPTSASDKMDRVKAAIKARKAARKEKAAAAAE